jgi:hypothetical protein
LQAEQKLLHRVADRIRAFAMAQRASISDVSVKVPGGTAGHTVSPCRTAGCYAPGGRYPLPSSVLMTAVTARVAGVTQVIVASPRPVPITIGAAFVAGADHLLAVGGAQAIAALAYGACAVDFSLHEELVVLRCCWAGPVDALRARSVTDVLSLCPSWSTPRTQWGAFSSTTPDSAQAPPPPLDLLH